MMKSLSESLKTFDLACRQVGLKVTHQRREIYRELLLSLDHPTADALHRRLLEKLPMLSLDTVYRNLAVLANHGLINRVETAESLSRFEATHSRHHHLICRECAHIVDFQWPLVDEVELPEDVGKWGRIDQKNVIIYGICNTCLNSSLNHTKKRFILGLK